MKYLYSLTYQEHTFKLCQMELNLLFNTHIKDKTIFSDLNINPSTSPFIKDRIEIAFEANTIDQLVEKLKVQQFALDDFKLVYLKQATEPLSYQLRIAAIKEIAAVIDGEGNIDNPSTILALKYYNNKWYLGTYTKNNYPWLANNTKPFSYCNSLGADLATSLINIASANLVNPMLVDPCCGIGTVVIEGLNKGINIDGYELNYKIAHNANQNLAFFDYPQAIYNQDMHMITKHYDVAIIDIPYGLTSSITPDGQLQLLKSCSVIATQTLLVSCEELDHLIAQTRLKTIAKISLQKTKGSGFTRYIYRLETI